MRICTIITRDDRDAPASGAGARTRWSGRIVPVDERASALGAVWDGDPLTPRERSSAPDEAMIGGAPAERIVMWSGSLSPDGGARDPRTWGPPGQHAFEDLVERLRRPALDAGRRILWRPHARHVLCDVQRALSFVLSEKRRPECEQCYGIALDPAALLERSMLDAWADHLDRALGVLGAHAEMIIVSGVRGGAQAEGDEALTLAPVDEGILDSATIGSLLRAGIGPATPVVLWGGDVEAQVRGLRLTLPVERA